MKKQYRLRASAVLATVATVISVGTVGIKAVGTCQRLVTRVVQRAAPNHRVSRATLARWAEWNKSHPNYHAPAHRRPAASPRESSDKMNFACEVPVQDGTTDGLLAPPMTPDFIPAVPAIPVQIATVDTGTPPLPPPVSLIDVPNAPPPTSDLPDVPEPAPIVYLGTAAALLLLARRFGWMRRSA